jgi:hypothetical protein
LLWKDTLSSSKAKILLKTLRDTEFIITIVCLSDVLHCTLPFSRLYQKNNIDLKTAQNILTDTISVINKKRQNCEKEFNDIFHEAQDIAVKIDYDLKLPRIDKIQTYRANCNTNDLQVYYRQSIYIPILEYVAEGLKARFSNSTLEVHNLVIFIPSDILKNTEINFSDTILNISKKNIFIFLIKI